MGYQNEAFLVSEKSYTNAVVMCSFNEWLCFGGGGGVEFIQIYLVLSDD